MYCNKSQKITESTNFVFEVSLSTFYFVSALQYLDSFYYQNPVKQTAFLYLKLPLKSGFF